MIPTPHPALRLPPECDRHTGQRLAARSLGLWFSGRCDQVEPAIRKALAERPQMALTALACLVADEQPGRAGILLRHALETNGSTVRRVEGLLRRGQHSIALSLAESLVLHSPGHPDAPARVCRVRMAKGEHAEARRLADDLVGRFPDARVAWRTLAGIALEMDDVAAALAAGARLSALPLDPTAPGRLEEVLLRARILMRTGDLDEALRLAGDAGRIAGNGAGAAAAAICQARIARLLGNSRMAAAILEAAAGAGPGDADVTAELGDALREIGLHGQAAAAARQTLRIVPDHRQALRCLAHASSRSGSAGSAADAFLRLLDIEPEDQDALYGLEAVLGHGTVSGEQAPPAASPRERAMALWARGKRLHHQNRPREAIVLLERAIAMDTALTGAAEDLGWCLLDLGWAAQAFEAFEAARASGSGETAAAGREAAAALRQAIEAPVRIDGAPTCLERLAESFAAALTLAGPAASVDPVDVAVEAAMFVSRAAAQAGQRVMAQRFAAATLDRHPGHPALRLLNAGALLATERHAEAYEILTPLIGEGWATSGMHQLAATCANACGDFAAAEAHLIAATAMVGHLAEAPGRLGDVRLCRGDATAAAAAFREAVRRMPSFAMPHQNYAARYDHTQYAMSGLESDLPDDALLADGFHRSGEGRIHLGDTARANHLFGSAIRANRRLGRDFRLGGELAGALGLNDGRVRILPHEWVIQIGHMAMLDTWLKIGALGWRPPATGVLLASAEHVVNRTYLDCWRPFLTVVEDPQLIERLVPLQRFVGECFNGWVGGDGRPEAFTDVGARAHMAWDREGREPLLHLAPDLHARGREALATLGMEADAWFVAIHIRGSGFHAEGMGSSQEHRNAGIDAYRSTIDMVTARGGWVVRMGDRSMPRFPEQARVIDYAHSPLKSDWMDVFLCAAARCFLGTTSGLANVAISFGTPSVLVNCLSNYAQLWPGNVTFAWRPYWSRREGRYLSLAEILSEPVRGATFSGNLLTTLELIPRDNDAEDIRSALEEALDSLDGQGVAEDTQAVRLWRDAAAQTCFFGMARPARRFAERNRAIFFPDD